MKYVRSTALSAALAAAFAAPGAQAQSNEALLKELKALRARVEELEQKVATPPKPAEPRWGMTPEQVQEFNRLSVKTEALEDQLESQGYKGLKITGFMEPVFIYNQRRDRAGFQFLNQQADGYNYDTSFMGSVSLDLLKETEGGTLWHLTLTPNRGAGAAIDGLSIVQEASVSVPLGSLQTRLIAGQMPDWSGYEYQQPTLNPFTTHNLLFDFTLPVSYTGVGLDLKDGQWWVRTAIANVNAAIRQDHEKSPVWVLRVDYAKGEFGGWGFASLVGKSPNFNTGGNTMAVMAEADGYFIRGDWTLQGQISAGRQQDGAITPAADGRWRDAQWVGLSGLAGYLFTPRLQGLVRADYINNDKNGGGLFTYNGYTSVDKTTGAPIYGNDDRNGLGPDLSGNVDKGANRYAVSLGMKYAFDQATTLKFEYRLDGADRAVFLEVKDGRHKKTNALLGASMVVAF
ncbi:DUF3138 family protein [Ideonella sp.]|uniref:DUF3138 family protein n=1 Tax=Ideonella sp. TaxID=1929293 RepID=UPI0035B063A9